MQLPAPFEMDGEHVAVQLPGARAVFTTRRGGRSQGPYASLNLGAHTDDDPAAVRANLAILAERFRVTPSWARQVHGGEVRLAHGRGGPSQVPGDGLLTREPGVAPMVLTADCMAIAVAGGGAVAMLHSGWRGLEAGVISRGVQLVRELADLADLADLAEQPLEAAIGPHAHVCCYEVGEEVHEAVDSERHGARAGRNLNMATIASAQLREAGVERTHDSGLCTMCSDASLFFSHRRDRGVTGRQGGIAWLS